MFPLSAARAALTKGWEVNSGFSFHGGTPYTVVSASNPSDNGEGADRAVQVVANPEAGVCTPLSRGRCNGSIPTAFVDAPLNTYSPTRRGQNYNPGYSAVDVAFIKNTQIVERVNTQFRVDVFNIFNRTNMAPVGFPSAGEAVRSARPSGRISATPASGPASR